ERHRHRFEVNNRYRQTLEAAGMTLSGQSPDGRLVEIVELKDHPWFVASQFHPEFKSRPERPHPLFDGFVTASLAVRDGREPLYAKVGGSYDEILKQVCKITPGPVSAECVSDEVDGMLEEGRHYATLAPNIVVKVAMSENGLEAISRFAEEGIKTNCTLIFTANQGLLAAKAGASLISPFVGRLDDINQDGMIVIRELAEIFAIHEIESEVLAAS